MSWTLNQVGISLNETGYSLNGNPAPVSTKFYYTGFFHTTKALLRRGLGF